MGRKRYVNAVLLSILACMLAWANDGFSDPLPKSTQAILKKLNLESSILSGLDSELRVSGDLLEKAKKEGALRITSTMDASEADTLLGPFKERYPFIKEFKVVRTTRRERVKTLLAYRSGRIITDVQTAMGGLMLDFKKANALEDLSDLPTFKNLPEGARDPEGQWVGIETNFWCIAYNTQLVKKQELPQWEDLVTNPRWRGGNLALGNRPELWALPLWTAKGEQWGKGFLTRLFREVHPQLRKEGMNALTELLAAGEFQLVIPQTQSHVYQKLQTGAPVGYHCPEPVPGTVVDTVVIKGAANVYAGKLFMNWVLSKEGQIAQYAATDSAPSHRDLIRKEFIPLGEEVAGKKVSYRVDDLQVRNQVYEFWNNLWLHAGKGMSRAR
ncbi:MAG TPA: extracellular solute-binding protein [Candidatus Binatia bacterium]